MHFIIASYINSIEPPPKRIDEISKIPKRFAKFILTPPEKKEISIVQKIKKKQERKLEKVKIKKTTPKKKIVKPKKKKIPEKPEKKAEKKSDKQKEKKTKPESKKMTKLAQKSKEKADKMAIRERLKTKALLGVFTSRKIEETSREMFSSIDKALGGIIRSADEVSKEAAAAFEILESEFEEVAIEEVKIEEIEEPIRRKEGQELAKLASKQKVIIDKGEKKKKITRTRSKSSIDRVVRSYIGGLKFIYNKELRRDNTLSGKIVVKFIISPEGKVIHAEIIESTFNNENIVTKMLKRIYKWKFSPEDLDNTTIIYPFIFLPTG